MADQPGGIEMKNQLKTTFTTLALLTIFASVSYATPPADEYEFTALDNDVVIEYSSPLSLHECNSYAALQNRIDLVLEPLQYDVEISKKECSHPVQSQIQAELKVERMLTELGFDG